MTVPGLVWGRVNRASSQELRFGGKGINVSYVLKEFGGKSVLTGFTAGFTGDALADGLAHEGFVCDFVKLSEGNTRINVKLTGITDDGDPDTELNAPGPTPKDEDLRSLICRLSHLSKGDAVVLAGSLPCGVPTDFIKTISKSLPEGVALICDLSGDALRFALSVSPYFVKPNIHELYEISGIDASAENLRDRSLIEGCAEKLIRAGAKNVLVTMGEDGGYFAVEDGRSGFVPPPKYQKNTDMPRSAVGCGDSAVAGWLIGMGFAGDNAQLTAFEAAGISTSETTTKAAAKLAVILGTTSYACAFPPSPEKVKELITP